MGFINIIIENYDSILQVISYTIAITSIIVRLTPTLRDDHFFKPIIKILGKYFALNKYSPKGEVKELWEK